MRNLAELDLIESGPSTTRQDIARFEERIGAALPEAYISFLLHANGGSPDLSAVRTKSGAEWSASMFYHLTDNADDGDGLPRAYGTG